MGESCSGAGVCQCDESDPDAIAKCVCDENFSGDYCETYTLPVEKSSPAIIDSSGGGVPAIEGKSQCVRDVRISGHAFEII